MVTAADATRSKGLDGDIEAHMIDGPNEKGEHCFRAEDITLLLWFMGFFHSLNTSKGTFFVCVLTRCFGTLVVAKMGEKQPPKLRKAVAAATLKNPREQAMCAADAALTALNQDTVQQLLAQDDFFGVDDPDCNQSPQQKKRAAYDQKLYDKVVTATSETMAEKVFMGKKREDLAEEMHGLEPLKIKNKLMCDYLWEEIKKEAKADSLKPPPDEATGPSNDAGSGGSKRQRDTQVDEARP
jgi:hypothetical protein